MEKVVEITKKDFKNLHQALKKCDKGWVAKLIEKVKELHSDDEYNEVNEQKIYNIFNGRSSGSWKPVIYKHAKELLAEYQSVILEAKAS